MTDQSKKHDALWYWYLTGEKSEDFKDQYEWQMQLERTMLGLLPHGPRCLLCDMPFAGVGGAGLRLMGRGRSSYSPKICNSCEKGIRKREGGADVDLTLLFADVRGSTRLADELGSEDFRRLIQRFYKIATDVLVHNNAMVNRLMGDQVIGLFVPRFAGQAHARLAIDTALELVEATGKAEGLETPIPIGVGVHKGSAFVGAVGSSGSVGEIAVLGNAANLTARLSSAAAEGEILVSVQAIDAANYPPTQSAEKTLDLKGFSEPVVVYSIRTTS